MQRNPPGCKLAWRQIQISPPDPFANTIRDMDSFNSSMVEGASWSDDEPDITQKGTGVFHPNLELIEPDKNEEQNPINPISIDILPDDMHERILTRLPLPAILKASCVCKKWNQIIHSNNFTLNNPNFSKEKTWYFMFASSIEPVGYLYDPGLRKWYNFDLPFMVNHTWNVSPSGGLVCFLDDENNKETYICNPITREYEILKIPPSAGFPVYSALAFSVDQSKSNYTISIVRSMQASDDFLSWNVSIHVYDSNKMTWLPPVTGALEGWRPGDVSVICENVLYVLVFSTRPNDVQYFHGLITYNLENTENPENAETSIGILKGESVISPPCALTCGRLMNVKKKLVLVGGIGRRGRPGVIKGIGIWVLDGKEWREITRMPSKFVQGFGELDDVFASSGGGDLIYIQSYGGTALLVYDMEKKQWFWSHKCSMHKKFPLEIFSGFCFEPELRYMS